MKAQRDALPHHVAPRCKALQKVYRNTTRLQNSAMQRSQMYSCAAIELVAPQATTESTRCNAAQVVTTQSSAVTPQRTTLLVERSPFARERVVVASAAARLHAEATAPCAHEAAVHCAIGCAPPGRQTHARRRFALLLHHGGSATRYVKPLGGAARRSLASTDGADEAESSPAGGRESRSPRADRAVERTRRVCVRAHIRARACVNVGVGVSVSARMFVCVEGACHGVHPPLTKAAAHGTMKRPRPTVI
jgi:hypothetical protein